MLRTIEPRSRGPIVRSIVPAMPQHARLSLAVFGPKMAS
jgi:hypothetical protein